MRWRLASVAISLVMSGCHLFGGVDVPVGTSDLSPFIIPGDMSVSTGDMAAPTCGLNSCAQMNANCGPIGDGCGGVINCGMCTQPHQTCGGGGTLFQCGGMAGCTPLSCAALNLHCGPAGDGCGNTIDCGGCPTGQTCGGGGVAGACGAPGVVTDMGNGGTCVPRTCQFYGFDCGQIGDGCGNSVNCGPLNGNCPMGQTCGGGGKPGHCGAPACLPDTCQKYNYNCGMIGDGCGHLLDCSNGVACPAGTTCGGGGQPNICGKAACTPKTCQQLGFNCGLAGDGCGNQIDCSNGMTCPGGTSCGGGGQPNVCGKPNCTPKTCKDLQYECGAAGDGCGGLIPGGCGPCPMGEVCGAFQPNRCGSNLPDGGAGGNCANGANTTITGTVVAATDSTAGFGDPDPIPNATVYVPSKPLTTLTAGATCDKCSANIPAIVTTTTALDGTFTLVNPPTGVGVTVVIQLGKWRRVLTLTVAACQKNTLTLAQTRLPRTQAEFSPFDNIPRIALATGDVDVLECVLRKMGVADSEFDTPRLNAGGVNTSTHRVHIYQQSTNANNGAPGAIMNATNFGTTPSDQALWGNANNLNSYDAVLMPCTGGGDERTASFANLQSYTGAGGRFFTTHYGYVFLHDNPPWGCNTGCAGDNCTNADCTTAGQTTADWTDDTQYSAGFTGFIDTSFPKGQLLSNWLNFCPGGAQPQVCASTTMGQIPVNVVRNDFNSVIYGQQWMYSTDPPNVGPQQMPIHYTFNTPTTSQPADQCGRVVYSDFHVETTPEDVGPPGCRATNCGGRRQPPCCGHSKGVVFPAECDGNSAMTPQEKLLEFMLFDLTSCVQPDIPVCTPKTCAQLGYTCGQWGDGCGGTINCCPGGAQNCCAAGSVCQGGTCVGGCVPTTCAQLAYSCGLWGDGCGNTLNCCPGGTPANGQCCTAGQTCGGGGTTGQCGGGCTKIGCLGATCGVQSDGCGGTQSCCPGGVPPDGQCCTNGQTCGGGGVPNQCGGGCKPLTCQQLNLNCGPAGDGCGGIIASCCPNGAATCCVNGQTCGGGGLPGQCGQPPDGGVMCTPLTCQQQGLSCGKAGDGCGNLIDCGPCPPGQTCGGGGTPGKCGAPNCTPRTCASINANCGIIGDGCGGTVDCGSCTSPETCGGGGQANVCGRIL
jgi:hypothetical protein